MATTQRAENPYLTEVTNGTWSSVLNDGFVKISIKCTAASTGNGTITGLGTEGGAVGTGITLIAGDSFSYVAEPGASIILTAAAAAGCTLQIVAG